jgi:hypothetical protein
VNKWFLLKRLIVGMYEILMSARLIYYNVNNNDITEKNYLFSISIAPYYSKKFFVSSEPKMVR